MTLAAFAQFPARTARAVPILTPHPSASATLEPVSHVNGNTLPYGSVLSLTLDGSLSSGSSRAGQHVPAHLTTALVVNGATVAAAGTPVSVEVVDASPASNPDIYGFIDLAIAPLPLTSGATLPLRPPTSHLTVNVSAGHEATVGVENTVGDIFSPTLLLHAFRKGHNFTLEPGAIVHALTQATLQVARDGTIAVVVPPPMVLDVATPFSTFKAVPLITPNPEYQPQIPASQMTPEPAATPCAHLPC